jgi:hypothetical protein
MREKILGALKGSADVGVDDPHPILALPEHSVRYHPAVPQSFAAFVFARRQAENLPGPLAREIAYRRKSPSKSAFRSRHTPERHPVV